METNKNEAITSRDVDFAKWYTDVCRKAELMDYSSVKGFIIYRPYGYAIWEQIQNYLNNQKEFLTTDQFENMPSEFCFRRYGISEAWNQSSTDDELILSLCEERKDSFCLMLNN